MKIKNLLLCGILGLLCSFTAQGQTLFTYGGHPVSKDEFVTVYKKNTLNKQQSKAGISEYLDLYALFRMKVQQALDMKLDTTAAVIGELNKYKAQLAKSELVDKAVTKRLVEEAYDRMKTDVRVAHILIAVRPNEDSLTAKKKIDSIYNVLISHKADFAEMAKKYSEDQTTASEGGELGYITALQTPYHFETEAYTTAVGQISKPFRTIYGYDIIKVQDHRPDPGKIQVAQILISSPDFKGPAYEKEALRLAKEVESKLHTGADFDDLVTKYSDDRYTKNTKGIMPAFGIGEWTPDFEKAAFALKKPGEISAPIHTSYGYHIIKLIKRIPLKPLDSIRHELTVKVENDSREAEAKEVYFDKVKKTYNFKEFAGNFKYLLNIMGEDTGKSFSPEKYPGLTNPLFSMDDKNYLQSDFLAYADKLTKGNFVGKKQEVLISLYRNYKSYSITKLQEEKLEKNNPEYRDMIKEYKNGILLFDLMNKKVWTKASTDSAGLNAFFENNKSKYVWQPGFEGTVFQSNQKKALELLQSYLNQGEDVEMAVKKVDKEMNLHAGISRQTGRFTFNQVPIEKQALIAQKASSVFKNSTGDSYGLVYVSKLFPNAEGKNLEDARGFVMADYQDYLEKQWESELKKKYPLEVNDRVLKKIERRNR